MPGEDHDLLIRIDERVGEIQGDMRGIRGIVDEHGTRISNLEAAEPIRQPGIFISKAVVWAGVLILVLALGGALTLDLHKAGEVVTLAKTAAGR